MNNKLKIIPLFIFGIFCTIMGFTDVHASTLVQKPIDDVYYTRRGGDQSYLSAQYNTYTMDGKTVYCIEPGVDITTHSYNGAEGWINSPYSKEINQKIQLIGYYGYEHPSHKTLRYRMAAQALIWETVGGQIVEYWTEQYGYGDYININKEKNDIMALVNAHYQVPSFNGESKTAIIGQEITFTDSKNILSNYEIYRSENTTSSITGNTLSITPNIVGDVLVSLKRKSYTNDPTTIFVGIDANSQKMGLFGLNDPIVSSVSLNVLGGKVSLQKVDSKTLLSIPRGNGELKNAVYGIYDENDIRVGQVITDENGFGTSDYLPALKKFYAKEEINSLGYKLDETKYWFEVTNEVLNPSVKVYEQAIERDVELFKVFANGNTTILTAEPNITFTFRLKSTMELYATGITDADSRLKVTLPYGVYVVHQETTTPNYEKIPDFEIVIDDTSTDPITKIISNAEITAKLKLVKTDSDSNKVIVRDGIKFKIKDLDTNEYVCQNITYPNQTKICVFETSDGAFITPYVLNSGNYQIEELEEQTIDGYLWNPTPLKFSIDENSKFIYDEEYGVMLEVKFSNKQVKAEVEINKYGEKLIIEDNSFRYEEIKLDGVSYDLYADGDIVSQDGTLIYNDKDLVKSLKTIDGYYKITDLYLGSYCLVETASVLGHVKDETAHCFTLNYKDQYTDIVSLSFTFKNHLPKGTLIFNKSDLVTGEPIANTYIEVYSDNEETNESTLIFSGYTDSNGLIEIKDLFIGKGHIIEKESADGYQLTDEIVYFEILEDGQVVKANMTNEKVVVPNTSISDSKVINIIGFIMIAFGIGYIIYDKTKKK